MWQPALQQLDGELLRSFRAAELANEWRAWIYRSSGETGNARRICEGSEFNMRLQSVRAIVAANDGEHEYARFLAQDAVDSRRDRAELAMAHVVSAVGDNEAAVYWFERAATRSESQQPLRHAARLLAELGSWDEARVPIERAIRSTSFVRWEDLAFLAKCLRQTGNSKLAIEIEAVMPGYQSRDQTAMRSVEELCSVG